MCCDDENCINNDGDNGNDDYIDTHHSDNCNGIDNNSKDELMITIHNIYLDQRRLERKIFNHVRFDGLIVNTYTLI